MRQPAFIDQSLFAELAQKAADNLRGRQHPHWVPEGGQSVAEYHAWMRAQFE